MGRMFDSFIELLKNREIVKIIITALAVGVLVSICASLLGVSLVLKKYSMIGDGLSHVGYGALAVSAALGISGSHTLEVSVPIVVAAAFFLLKLSEKSKINSDAAVAAVSTSSIAIGTVIFSLKGGTAADACSSLFGSASLITITEKDLIISVVLSIVTIVLFVFFYNRIFAVTFDEDFAKATGIKANLYNMLIAVLTAVTIVLGMSLMGAILISGLIIFPTLSSMRLCGSFKRVVVFSAVISVFCFIFGFLGALLFNLQIGPAVIIANLIFYLFAVGFSKIKKSGV